MKLSEAEVWLRRELHTIYGEREAAVMADWVMENITGLKRLDRVTKRDKPLEAEQQHKLASYHKRLLQHEPVQYVLEEAHFYGMKLFVDKSVLIPRPETEELVEWIVNDVKQRHINTFEKVADETGKTNQLKILDVGTGSGCIALALKKRMPKAEVWGCDISAAALSVARRNSSELNIQVNFVSLDFLDEVQQEQLPSVDILVSNPPYIPMRDKADMQKNVVEHEPHTALFVPDKNALIFYKALARFAKSKLHNGGSIYAEIHENLGKEIVELFTTKGFEKVELRKDMQGKDRMIKAERKIVFP